MFFNLLKGGFQMIFCSYKISGWNIWKGSKSFWNDRENHLKHSEKFLKILKHFLQHSEIFKNVPRHSYTYSNILESSSTFWNILLRDILENLLIYWHFCKFLNLLEYSLQQSGIFENILRHSIAHSNIFE